MTTYESSGDRERADLLPFFATDSLPLAEMRQIEAALAEDEVLRRELALVEEEQAATVRANQMLGLPSARAADRFLAMLDAEPARMTPRAVPKGSCAWIGERLRALAPRQIAYGGIAAAVLLIAQASFIGALMQRPTGTNPTLAMQETTFDASYLAVVFASDAKVSEISRLLQETHGDIIGGPKGGGLYTLRIGSDNVSKAEHDGLIARLGAEKRLVRHVLRLHSPSP